MGDNEQVQEIDPVFSFTEPQRKGHHNPKLENIPLKAFASTLTNLCMLCKITTTIFYRWQAAEMHIRPLLYRENH